MDKKIVYWLAGGLVVIIGVLVFLFYPISKNVGLTNTTATSPKDGTYLIEGQPVTLVNGKSVVSVTPGSATKITTQYFGNEAVGDLNADGFPDTVFILTQNSGGSGTFYYVAVALGGPNGYTGTNGVLLGDRIAPQTTEIKNAEVIVNYADRKPGEATTVRPSVGVSKYLILNGNQLTETTNPNVTPVVYKNTDYGFNFSLPASWQGYSIIKSTWEGTALTNAAAPSGPKLIIRNPKWTEAAHYEDIPILVFTIPEWNSYLAEDYAVSAAPIQARELARNNKYVFALPPRWDYDFSLGYKEAEDIISGSPLHAFSL
jgi:hypothetical protein